MIKWKDQLLIAINFKNLQRCYLDLAYTNFHDIYN